MHLFFTRYNINETFDCYKNFKCFLFKRGIRLLCKGKTASQKANRSWACCKIGFNNSFLQHCITMSDPTLSFALVCTHITLLGALYTSFTALHRPRHVEMSDYTTRSNEYQKVYCFKIFSRLSAAFHLFLMRERSGFIWFCRKGFLFGICLAGLTSGIAPLY